MQTKVNNVLNQKTNKHQGFSTNATCLLAVLVLGLLSGDIMADTGQESILNQSQNLIKNPSFEQGESGEHWIAKDGKFERHHSSILKVACVDGEHYAELASDKGYKLTQTITVVPGEAYELAFYTQARPRMSQKESDFSLKINGKQLELIQPVFDLWQKKSYPLIAQTNRLEISFEDLHYGRAGVGAMIDLVSVRKSQPASTEQGDKSLKNNSANKKVLVLTATEISKFRHGPQTSASIRMIRDLAATENWTLNEIDEPSKVNKHILAGTDVIIFAFTGGNIFDPLQEKLFEAYIRDGGKTIGIHTATYTEKKNPLFMDLVGGAFARHPPFQTAQLNVHFADDVSTQHLPPVFQISDEWYFYDRNPSDDPDNKILISVDEGSYEHQGLAFGEGKVHPITWSNEKYGGRHWYTSLGHTLSTLDQGWFRQHIRSAINWTLSENEVNDQWVSLFNGKDLTGWHVDYARDEDSDEAYVKVNQNSILLDTMDNGKQGDIWFTSDQEYGDFELRLKVQVYRDSTGNSGIQVRSRMAKTMQGPQIDLDTKNQLRNGLIYDMTTGNARWLYPDLPLKKTSEIKDHIKQPRGYYFVFADDETAHKTGKSPRQLEIPEKLDYLVTNTIFPHKATWEIGWNSILIRSEGTKITTFINEVLTANYDGEGLLNDALHQKADVGMKGHIAVQIHGKHKLKMRIKDIELRQLYNTEKNK